MALQSSFSQLDILRSCIPSGFAFWTSKNMVSKHRKSRGKSSKPQFPILVYKTSNFTLDICLFNNHIMNTLTQNSTLIK
jgi:hypothetical protein